MKKLKRMLLMMIEYVYFCTMCFIKIKFFDGEKLPSCIVFSDLDIRGRQRVEGEISLVS